MRKFLLRLFDNIQLKFSYEGHWSYLIDMYIIGYSLSNSVLTTFMAVLHVVGRLVGMITKDVYNCGASIK